MIFAITLIPSFPDLQLTISPELSTFIFQKQYNFSNYCLLVFSILYFFSDTVVFFIMSVVSTWKPKTPIGRKVKRGELNLEQILSQKLQIQEPGIFDHLIPNGLHVEILKTSSIGDGQYRRKAWVAIADRNGLLGLGSRCARTTTEAIRGATKNAKLSIFRIDL